MTESSETVGSGSPQLNALEDLTSFLDDLSSDAEGLINPVEDSDGFIAEEFRFYLALWLEALSDDATRLSMIQAPEDMRSILWINQNLLDNLRADTSTIRSALESLLDVSRANWAVDHLGELMRSALRRAKHHKFDYMEVPARFGVESLVAALEQKMESHRLKGLERLEEHIKASAQRADVSAAKAAAAAGISSDAAMSSFYQQLAKSERGSADTFRWLTTFMVLVAGGVALTFVLGTGSGVAWLDIGSGDYVHLLQKVILVAGVFGLAGYFARQAHQHRSMANWAGSLAVQLQTFDAYLEAIESSEIKDELRKSFASRVFGDHPVMKGEPTVTPSAAAMDTAVGWATKLMAGGGK